MKSIRKVLIFLALSLIFSSTGFGKSVQNKLPALGSASPTQMSTTVISPSADLTPPSRLRFSPTMGMENGNLGYGGMGELSFSTGAPFFIGVEAGYLQFSGATASATGNTVATLIPILATFTYRFNLERGPVHPYLAFGVGASITNYSLAADGNLQVSDATSMDFMYLGRPGVEFQLSHVTSFFVEPALGNVKGQFVFLPQVGFAFSL